MKFAVTILCFLFVPFIAFGAGFAKQSLFLSRSVVIEGETVLIHTIVSNDAGSKFSGILKLSDESGVIGNVPVSLDAQEAQVVSVSWKPSFGSHAVMAKLQDANGVLVEQQPATFVISSKPQQAPTAQTAAIVDSSQNIQQAIENISPAVAQAAQPVFAAIDAGRASASNAVDQGINWAKQQVESGTVLSSQTQKNGDVKTGKGVGETFWFVLVTIILYILSILQYIIGSAAIFYPVFAALFFYALWRLYRHYSRPAWQR